MATRLTAATRRRARTAALVPVSACWRLRSSHAGASQPGGDQRVGSDRQRGQRDHVRVEEHAGLGGVALAGRGELVQSRVAALSGTGEHTQVHLGVAVVEQCGHAPQRLRGRLQ